MFQEPWRSDVVIVAIASENLVHATGLTELTKQLSLTLLRLKVCKSFRDVAILTFGFKLQLRRLTGCVWRRDLLTRRIRLCFDRCTGDGT